MTSAVRIASASAFDPSRPRKVAIFQGEQYVCDEAGVMISTLLGSCVAACLRDPVRGVGGMNHFLLPGRRDGCDDEGLRFGVHAMELLVNALLVRGARRERLQAKLFGGANLSDGLADIGRQNIGFALAFLQAEGIDYAGGSLGGVAPRRVQFWPKSGRARQLLTRSGEQAIFAQEIRRAAAPVGGNIGAVELF